MNPNAESTVQMKTLREWRAYKKLSKRKVAEVLGVSESTYVRMEETPYKLSIKTAMALSEFYQCDLREINFFE
ncbi:helix-turn-helix transcriptional regulator [Paenibacillus sp. EKM206P]|uniref:helix-turn-helix domain-containing protein n=1 Tax=Paenibacillus sp. EKM206P TaxID=1683674 RepID=UPI0013ED2A33|nr:helix-turn-helix transcriptional regulator [Paenibacillus sp. EKM206P]KAF6569044.1 helix-turn-helix transcriptional regulator [Paenibacillus sp. EKM206P]